MQTIAVGESMGSIEGISPITTDSQHTFHKEAPSVKVLVAAHKPYWMPQDSLYVPTQVGAQGKEAIEGFQRDDEGDNISAKNPRYCELTALYWGAKNVEADYIGLVHYRRHFKGAGERDTLTLDEARELLSETPVIVPQKRNYYIETLEDHYGHTFDSQHIAYVREVIAGLAPEYSEAFDRHMAGTKAHMFNMLIMRKDLLDAYLAWLFPILETVESRIDFTDMTDFEARAMGRLSERLLDVWLTVNDVPYTEVPAISLEKTNWLKKGTSFLAAKFTNKKYEKSF